MGSFSNLVGGAAFGAGLMYVLDPDMGTRRRAVVRDQARRRLDHGKEFLDKTSRDMANRTRGLKMQATRLAEGGAPVSDEVLHERVRAKLGRLVSHPRAVDVTSRGGVVELRGPILRREVSRLLNGIKSVSGVKQVENRLEVHDAPGNVPALQGDPEERMEQFELLQRNWSPTARLLAGTAGTVMALRGLRLGESLSSISLGILGLGLLLRALSNTDPRDLFAEGDGEEEASEQRASTAGFQTGMEGAWTS